MKGAELEALLARLYTDAGLRARFLEDPMGVAADAGLAPEDAAQIAALDRTGLELAAASFARKRACKAKAGHGGGILARLARRLRS